MKIYDLILTAWGRMSLRTCWLHSQNSGMTWSRKQNVIWNVWLSSGNEMVSTFAYFWDVVSPKTRRRRRWVATPRACTGESIFARRNIRPNSCGIIIAWWWLIELILVNKSEEWVKIKSSFHILDSFNRWWKINIAAKMENFTLLLSGLNLTQIRFQLMFQVLLSNTNKIFIILGKMI